MKRLPLLAFLIAASGCAVDEPTTTADDTAVSPAEDVSGDDIAAADDLATAEDAVAEGMDIQAPEPDVEEPPDFPPAPAQLGGTRPANYQLPKAYDPSTPWPVVLLLHGYGASGAIQSTYLGLGNRVDQDGFILITPDGTLNPQGKQFWNATPACCNFFGSPVDDVAYLTGLITEAKAHFNIDDSRVGLIGHSNGGFMSYRLACEASDVFSGLVSIAGSVHWDATACAPTQPVSVLQVHGDKDGTIGYLGDTGAYPSAQISVERWAGYNGCTAEPAAGTAVDIDTGLAGAETAAQDFSGCNDDTAVSLWTIVGGGHIPAFTGGAFAELAVKFLQSHPKQD